MSGIAGVLYRDPKRKPDVAVLKAMAGALAHRGPDGGGALVEPAVGLVHRRLAVIDPEGGHQPMCSEDGSVQVVFDGAIYNYPELRRKMEAKGHAFRTRSDAEVLLHLYEQEGEELAGKLRGMFAFALWDRKNRRLVLARDHVGLKPLFVYRDAEKLVFGSEIKAILAHPRVERKLDPRALDDYLAFGAVSGERSIFASIRKLPPAHAASYHPDNMDVSPRRYWGFHVDTSRKWQLLQWQQALEAKIIESVEAHQLSDVPVGATISGGLNSAVVAAAHASLSASPIATFALGFESAESGELPLARQVAEKLGAAHTERVVALDPAAALAELVRSFDEPFADPAAVPMLALARLARESVKVVLSGDGGDEALGGHERYRTCAADSARRSKLAPWVRRLVLGPLRRLRPASGRLARLAMDDPSAYAGSVSLCPRPLRRRLLSGDVLALLAEHRPEEMLVRHYGAAAPGDPLAAMLTADIQTLLPERSLTLIDRTGMSCGLEVRAPLADHEFLDLCGQIPSEFKIREGKTKWILKKAFEPRLPGGLTGRPSRGFDLPVDDWLRGPLADGFRRSVLDPASKIGTLVSQPAVEGLFTSHCAGKAGHGDVLWALLVLARWAERYL